MDVRTARPWWSRRSTLPGACRPCAAPAARSRPHWRERLAATPRRWQPTGRCTSRSTTARPAACSGAPQPEACRPCAPPPRRSTSQPRLAPDLSLYAGRIARPTDSLPNPQNYIIEVSPAGASFDREHDTSVWGDVGFGFDVRQPGVARAPRTSSATPTPRSSVRTAPASCGPTTAPPLRRWQAARPWAAAGTCSTRSSPPAT